MKSFLALLILFAGLLPSCQDKIEQNSEPEYIIFGHFYGMCAGEECVELFKISNNELFEDSKDNYPSNTEFAKTNFSKLEDAQRQKTTNILSEFPITLLNDVEPSLGCADCHDQGGLYLEYKKGKTRKFWIIDNDKTNVESYLHNYIDEINRVISEINNEQ
ncbi:MAG: hypothetical protein JXQ87_02160 [Bacteroidia bacterium]